LYIQIRIRIFVIPMKSSNSRFNKCLYFSANALARKVEKLATESWKKIDLSPSHAYLLMMVLDEPGAQPGAIAKEMQLTPSTITRLIEKLEHKKLVLRATEGKVTNVYATPKAKDLYPAMKLCLKEFSKKYLEILGTDASVQMIENINQLTDRLPE
jgi:MarR family transcriptional regulator, organic hydroperoxide resistance regulator